MKILFNYKEKNKVFQIKIKLKVFFKNNKQSNSAINLLYMKIDTFKICWLLVHKMKNIKTFYFKIAQLHLISNAFMSLSSVDLYHSSILTSEQRHRHILCEK